jgi:hypothetical protein
MENFVNKTLNKTEQVRAALANGDKKAALVLAHTFRLGMNAEQRKAVKSGYEAQHFGDFYRQCGKDPEALIQQAWEVLLSLPFLQQKQA